MLGEGWNVPSEAEGSEDFRWYHVSGTRPMVAVITCESPLWYTGHYHRGRMNPCCGDECSLCDIGVGSQVRFVFALADCTARTQGLLETGRTVAQEIRDIAARSGELRGLMLEITKHSLSRKSRMEVAEIVGDPGDWWQGFKVIDLKEALLATWSKAEMQLPDMNVDPAQGRNLARSKARVSSPPREQSRPVR